MNRKKSGLSLRLRAMVSALVLTVGGLGVVGTMGGATASQATGGVYHLDYGTTKIYGKITNSAGKADNVELSSIKDETNHKVTDTYCIEYGVWNNGHDTKYTEGSWAQAGVQNLPSISAIVQNSFPAISVEQLIAKSGVSGLTTADAALATQAAIWHFSDGYQLGTAQQQSTIGTARGERVVALYNWLLQFGATTKASEPVAPSIQLPSTATATDGKVGPITVNTSNGAALKISLSGTATGKYEDGSAVDFNAVQSGKAFYLYGLGTAGSLNITATGSFTIPVGQIFHFQGNQTQISAVVGIAMKTVTAIITWTGNTTVTGGTTTATSTSTSTSTSSTSTGSVTDCVTVTHTSGTSTGTSTTGNCITPTSTSTSTSTSKTTSGTSSATEDCTVTVTVTGGSSSTTGDGDCGKGVIPTSATTTTPGKTTTSTTSATADCTITTTVQDGKTTTKTQGNCGNTVVPTETSTSTSTSSSSSSSSTGVTLPGTVTEKPVDCDKPENAGKPGCDKPGKPGDCDKPGKPGQGVKPGCEEKPGQGVKPGDCDKPGKPGPDGKPVKPADCDDKPGKPGKPGESTVTTTIPTVTAPTGTSTTTAVNGVAGNGGNGGSGNATVTATVTAGAGSTGSVPPLAQTGSNTVPMLVGAMTLLAAGGLFLTLRGRREDLV